MNLISPKLRELRLYMVDRDVLLSLYPAGFGIFFSGLMALVGTRVILLWMLCGSGMEHGRCVES